MIARPGVPITSSANGLQQETGPGNQRRQIQRQFVGCTAIWRNHSDARQGKTRYPAVFASLPIPQFIAPVWQALRIRQGAAERPAVINSVQQRL